MTENETSACLNRDVVTFSNDAIFRIDIDQSGLVSGDFRLIKIRKSGDDEDVTGARISRCRTIDRDNAGATFTPNRVGRKTGAVVDVPDVDTLVNEDVGSVQKVFINRAGAFVIEVNAGCRDAMKLGFEQDSLHDFYDRSEKIEGF